MKKVLAILTLVAIIAVAGLIYKKYCYSTCMSTIISEEKIAYTPAIEEQFLLAQNAVAAFKENGSAPKIA